MSASEIFAPGMLDGRVVLVTGGGTGLGRAAAAELRACGAEVVISGRRREVLDAAAAELGAHAIAGDVREPDNAERIGSGARRSTPGSSRSLPRRSGAHSRARS